MEIAQACHTSFDGHEQPGSGIRWAGKTFQLGQFVLDSNKTSDGPNTDQSEVDDEDAIHQHEMKPDVFEVE